MARIDALPFPDYQQAQVLEVLKKAARNELITCNLYQRIERNAPFYQHPELQYLASAACQEDWNHYEILLTCIEHIQQDGRRPHNESVTGFIMPPVADSPETLLGQIKQAEQHSIAFQQQLCAMTMGYDYKLFDHAYMLLNENMQHNEQVNDWLRGAA
ncbi:MAG: hypothetical protein OIF57_03045 [Marinobacterium sp.]|nr:hypothetical protein [Marinobacterium sp.]